MTQTASDLAAHETFGEIFSRAHALYRGGKGVPVRGHMGIVRGFVNVSTPKGVRRDVFYFTQPRGVGCCLLAAAMIGLEVPTPVGIDQTTLAPIIPLPLSWLLYRTAAEKMGVLTGFDGLPQHEVYSTPPVIPPDPEGPPRPPLTIGQRISVDSAPADSIFASPAAYEFGCAARTVLEAEFGPIPWVGGGPDPDTASRTKP